MVVELVSDLSFPWLGDTLVNLVAFIFQDERSDGSAIQSVLGSMTGRSTVPNVFIGGNSVGGGDETAALQHSGRLGTLLQEAIAAKAKAQT